MIMTKNDGQKAGICPGANGSKHRGFMEGREEFSKFSKLCYIIF